MYSAMQLLADSTSGTVSVTSIRQGGGGGQHTLQCDFVMNKFNALEKTQHLSTTASIVERAINQVKKLVTESVGNTVTDPPKSGQPPL